MKHIDIRHWDYWYELYGIGKHDNTNISEVEFSLINPHDGSRFFHFDFYTLPALAAMLEESSYMGKDDGGYSDFTDKCNALKNGEIDFFIATLYYATYRPKIDLCNRAMAYENGILDLISPAYKPDYGVIFIGENQSLSPDLLMQWVKTVCKALFKQSFDLKISNPHTKDEAQANYDKRLY